MDADGNKNEERPETRIPQLDYDFLYALKRLVNIKTLKECVDCAAEYLENPVLIIDSSCKPIVHSKYEYGMDPGWDNLFHRGEYTYEYLASIVRYEEAHSSKLESGLPTLGRHGQSKNRRIAVRIFSQDIFLGTMIVLETCRTFEHQDADLAYIFANKAAHLIVEQRIFTGKVKVYKSLSMLITDRLDGLQGDRNNFEMVLSRFKNGDSDYFLVMVDLLNYSSHSPNALRDSLKQVRRNAESFFYNGNLLALIPLDHGKDMVSMLSFLNGQLASMDICAVISDKFSRLFDIPEYYRQVIAAMEMMHRLGTKTDKFIHRSEKYDHLIFYSDFRFLDMADAFLATNSQKSLSSLCDAKMIEMLEYDKRKDTRYLYTLWMYLNNDKNTQNTSRDLGIHRNTLNYHLRRMEELFELDYTDAWQMFCLYLSYLIYICYSDEEKL